MAVAYPLVNGVVNGVYVSFMFETWKKCVGCNYVKPLSEFTKCARRKDGLDTSCRDCNTGYRWQWKGRRETLQKIDVDNKECTKCGLTKPIDDFSADRYTIDGRKSWCKRCCCESQKERYARDPDSHREYSRAYYQNHRQTIIDRVRTWCEDNPERRAEYLRNYNVQNCEENRRRASKWQRENADRARERQRRWRERNRGKCNRASKKHKMLKRNLPGFHTSEQWESLCNIADGRCVRCHKKRKLTEDHIIPLTWNGSTDWIDNIQPLCRGCNAAKGNRCDTDYRPDHIKEWARIEMEGVR